MKKRRFGSECTSLRLSNAAFAVYSDSDPCVIYELEAEDGSLSYSITGIVDRDGMTEDELNAFLVDLGAEED